MTLPCARTRARTRVRRWTTAAGSEIAAVTLAVVPIVVAFVRSVRTSWMPIGDNALVEIRARDVFTTDHFPLLGTWSSASRAAGKNLNHPGPLLFDLLAVPVRVLGGPVGVAFCVALINALAVVGIAVVARRVGGREAALVAAVVAATLSWTLGSEMLISPWNPHVLILPFLLVLVLAWGVGAGDIALMPWLLAVASLCLQTHVGYAYLVPAVVLLAFAGAAMVVRRRWRTDPACRADDLPRVRRGAIASATTVFVLWAQPLWEQFTGTGEGNLSRLLTSSGGDEPAIGLSLGARIVGGVVAAPPWWGRSSFMDTVSFTPLASDGSAPDPAGLIGVGGAVVALVIVLGLLAVAAVSAYRRLDRPAFVVAVLAGASVIVALASFAIVPVGTIGLAAHQMRWVWSLGAFVAMALLVGVVRSPLLVRDRDRGRARDAVRLGAIGVVALMAVLNLPAHVHPDGPSAYPEAQESARALSRAIDDYEPGSGGVVFETGNLRFSEPYSTVVMSSLQRNGIDFFVEDAGMVRQLGEAREFDSRARTRLVLVEDRPALDVPEGAELVARATPLSDAEVKELIAGEHVMVERISLHGLAMTPEGSTVVDSGVLGVTVEEVDAAMIDAARLVAGGAVSRLVRANVLQLDPDDVELFQRIAALRVEVDLRTVAVFAVPA